MYRGRIFFLYSHISRQIKTNIMSIILIFMPEDIYLFSSSSSRLKNLIYKSFCLSYTGEEWSNGESVGSGQKYNVTQKCTDNSLCKANEAKEGETINRRGTNKVQSPFVMPVNGMMDIKLVLMLSVKIMKVRRDNAFRVTVEGQCLITFRKK